MGNIIGNWSQRDNSIKKQEEVVRDTTNPADRKGEQARLDGMRQEHRDWKELGR